MAAVAPAPELSQQQQEQPQQQQRASIEIDAEKNVNVDNNVNEVDGEKKAYDSEGSEHFQHGVNRIRAITSVWSTKTMILVFALLYLISFVDQHVVSVHYALSPWVMSHFGRHGLVASVGATSTILSGTCSLTIAKVIDIWGRIAGFLTMVALLVISLIMKATAQNFETYMGAYVLYWTGHSGILYVVDVMVADMTTLKNRMLVQAVMGTPLICSTFAGPKIGELFYEGPGWRWGFGAWAIIVAAAAIPVVVVMIIQEQSAKKAGLFPPRSSGRTWYQSIWFYTLQLDVVGIILVTFCFGLIMLPFNLVAYAPKGWDTPYIIAMPITGFVSGVLFYVWEKYFSPVQFIPWKYLKEPTIIGSCLVYGVMFLSCFVWNAYFSSYVQVVHRLGIADAGYIVNSFSLSAAIVSPLFGLLVRWKGNFKYVAYLGIPAMLVGTAIIIPLRQPNASVGGLAISQILNGIGTGALSATAMLAVTVPVTHQQIAVVIAIWGMFGSIGSSIGFAIAGAMWSNIFPGELMKRLPEESKNMTMTIFGDLAVQASFLDGTPERDAVVGTYAYIMRLMVIVGCATVPLVLASVYIWRNINVRQKEEEEGTQTKGNVF